MTADSSRPRHLEDDIAALKELAKSRGWAVLEQCMKDDILAAAMLIAENAGMTKDQIDFQRGAMWAAKRLLQLPARITQNLESNLSLENANRAATAAQE